MIMKLIGDCVSFLLVINILIGSYSQGELFFFGWPGPLEVPVDIVAVKPPDMANIAFADFGTDRQLRIEEKVFTTFNCSLVVGNLKAMQGIIPNSINTTWLLRKFDINNVLEAADPRIILDGDKFFARYDIFGDYNEFLNTTDPRLPTIAAEGESGIYTCSVCGDVTPVLAVGEAQPRICLNSTTTLLIAGNPPVIDESPGERFLYDFVGFRIGNDFCARIPLQQNAQGIDILCVQDPAFMIPVDPPPKATWLFNRAPVIPNDNPFTLDNDFARGIGYNGQLSIGSLSPTSAFVGEYMCNLTTVHGQDQSMSRIVVSDLAASVGINGRTDNGCVRFGISVLRPADFFCVETGENATITCSASGGYTISGPRGQVQNKSFTIDNITAADSGVYTCSSGPPCNDIMSFKMITVIFSGNSSFIINITGSSTSSTYLSTNGDRTTSFGDTTSSRDNGIAGTYATSSYSIPPNPVSVISGASSSGSSVTIALSTTSKLPHDTTSYTIGNNGERTYSTTFYSFSSSNVNLTPNPENVVSGTVIGAIAGVMSAFFALLALGVLVFVIIIRNKRKVITITARSDKKDLDYNKPYTSYSVQKKSKTVAKLSEILLPSLIEKSNLKLIDKVGQGEFGVVYRGLLTVYEKNEAEVQPVAIKTLKGKYSQTQTDELIVEAEKMIQFNHLNVLSLTGVCVSLLESPCLVMPYMSNGSLLSYLRKESADLVVSESANENLLMDTVKHLLSMCLQVANGMAYLAEQRFVHRDLAARNCMISADAIIKVADFGLAENICTAEYFKQERSSDDSVKLPLKWMALESIHYGKFSEKTDVWSYGILCWEVFSAGKSPYPGMSPREVVEMLDSGERLSKPLNPACTEEIYEFVLSCWNKSPDKRPHFADIVISAEKILAPLADYVEFTDTFA